MREIKFKVWDNVHKEWLIYKEWPVGWQCPMNKPAHLIINHMYVSQDNESFNELQFCIDSPYFDVLQYTGLKDKNNKEICEGDLIHISGYGSSVYEVIFEQGDFQTGFKKKGGNNLTDIGKEFCDKFEIIGNIYEK